MFHDLAHLPDRHQDPHHGVLRHTFWVICYVTDSHTDFLRVLQVDVVVTDGAGGDHLHSEILEPVQHGGRNGGGDDRYEFASFREIAVLERGGILGPCEFHAHFLRVPDEELLLVEPAEVVDEDLHEGKIQSQVIMAFRNYGRKRKMVWEKVSGYVTFTCGRTRMRRSPRSSRRHGRNRSSRAARSLPAPWRRHAR